MRSLVWLHFWYPKCSLLIWSYLLHISLSGTAEHNLDIELYSVPWKQLSPHNSFEWYGFEDIP